MCAPAKPVALARRSQLLLGELTNGFEQPEACLLPFVDGHQERTRDKPVEHIHYFVVGLITRPGKGLGGGEGERSREDR